MDPYIGKLLDGRYEILDVLGTGGMAVVYRAYCHRLNRYVAVKILKRELASDQDLRRRFHDESQAVAMLSHPNIVAIYDVSQVDDCEFIVMELIDGITLKQYMHKRGGCLNWREALHFITQILQGLKHAHSRGIIHRDIKPQNVMVLRDGSVKVTDFGIARSTTSQATMTQEAIGSVHYISPEQARGSHIDARSDIYSAGVVLYEMLSGRLPYEGDNPVSVAIQHINSIPISPRELNPSVPLGMEQITLKAMAPLPDRRYASAEEMLEDLESFRRNPDIDFGYSAPGVLISEEDEPTMVRKGVGGFAAVPDDPDATIREPVTRRAPARFEREEPQYPEESYDDYDDYDDDRRRNRMFIAVTAGAAALLILVFVILWFTLFRGLFAEKPEYTVPNLIGQTIEAAETTISTNEDLKGHFTITVGKYQPSDAYDAGQIMDQTPIGGRTTSQDTTEITVTVSSGPANEEPQEILLEDYTGQDFRMVKANLEAKLLIVSPEGEYSDTVEKDKVIRTEPGIGASVVAGSQVKLYYSLGPETKEFPMTNLLGLLETDARSAISTMGLTLASCTTEYSDEYSEGKVCYQSIPAGVPVTEGTAVSIQISLGPKPTEPEQPDEPDQPTQPEGPTTTPEEPVRTFVVYLPADRTENCVVELYINGALYQQATVSPTETDFSATYQGVINTYSIKVDGNDYNDYQILNGG